MLDLCFSLHYVSVSLNCFKFWAQFDDPYYQSRICQPYKNEWIYFSPKGQKEALPSFFSRLIRIASKIHQNGNGMSNRRHLLMLGSAFNKYLKWTLTIWTLMIFTSLRFFILCPLIISTFSGGQERCAYFGKCPYFGKMCLFWEVEDFES